MNRRRRAVDCGGGGKNEWTAGQAARKDLTMSKNEWKAQENRPCSVLKV